MLVTGQATQKLIVNDSNRGNAGIGCEIHKARPMSWCPTYDDAVFVQVLLNKGAKVYVASQYPKWASDAVTSLKEGTNGKEPVYLRLDLTELQSVRTAAVEFLG